MKTLAISNQKGGTGKTTTAAALGHNFTLAGLKVLFLDADPQGNLSRMCGVDGSGGNLYSALTGTPAHKVIYQTAAGAHIIPSDARLSAEAIFTGQGRERKIRRVLDEISSNFDVCIIDTPPTLGNLTINALTAADAVLIPARPDRFSVDGLRAFGETVRAVQSTANKALIILGVTISQYNGRTTLNRAVLEALTAQAAQLETKVYLPAIRRTISAEEWEYTGEIDTTSTAGQDYAAVAAQILADLKMRCRK